MSEAVGPNRVPAAPIVEAINQYLLDEGERIGDDLSAPAPIHILAERADIKSDTLDHILRGRSKTMDFDTADRLLCVTNQTALWITDLHEVYEQALLDEGGKQFTVTSSSGTKVCARRGCSNKFIPPRRSPRKKYCSKNCKTTAWKHRVHPPKTTIYGKDRKIQKLVCRNGHERTKENTGIQSNGYRYCLICHRAAASRHDHKRRQKPSLA